MRNFLISLAALAMAAIGSAAGAQDLMGDRPRGEVALSDETLQLRYVDSGKNVDVGRGSRFSGAIFLSEAREIVLSADLLFPAQLGIDRFQLLFGPRAYAALLEDENNDVLAVSLGAEIRYAIDSGGKLAISGQAFYAPDILTFGTADKLTDLSARIELQVQPRLTVFGGMRWFEMDLNQGNGTETLQEELFAGIGWIF
jgi:YfaZ precursor